MNKWTSTLIMAPPLSLARHHASRPAHRKRRSILLQYLPLDIHIMLLLFLGPADILALRQTCKALNYATRRRAVWLAALYHTIFQHGLFAPSFPANVMSTTQLEHAALAPMRFAARIRRTPPDSTVRPVAKRAMGGWDGRSLDVILVPGGRFLIVCAALNQCIQLWDLGCAGSTTKPRVLATMYHKKTVDILDIAPTPDGQGLVILITDRYTLVDIYPTAPNPTFRTLASLSFNKHDRIHVRALAPPLLAFCEGDNVTVWNYMTNMSATWMAKFSEAEDWYKDILIADSQILITSIDGCYSWRIPQLPYGPPTGKQTMLRSLPHPDHMLRFQPLESRRSDHYVPHRPWHNRIAPGRTFHIDIFNKKNRHAPTDITQYILQYSAPRPGAPRRLGFVDAATHVAPPTCCLYAESLQTGDREMLTVCWERHRPHVHYSSLGCGRAVQTVAVLGAPASAGTLSLDPSTGRMVTTSAGSTEISVIDYLHPAPV